MKAEDWATNLDKALNSFVIEQKTTQWPKSDITKIKEVVQELGLTGARFAFNSSHVYDIDEEHPFMRDQGVLHVHPTMLVATRHFSGSIDRGEKPYPLHRHFYPLSNNRDRSPSTTSDKPSNEVLCPKLMHLAKVGFECMCGEIHLKQ
jgi:hypothetical protein